MPYLVIDNYIDAEEFYKLTMSELEKIVKPIGLCKKIFRHITVKWYSY